ncbi:MAG: DUF1735 domain-containing protein [Bacteroidales bacterium]|nr:DUF1735 domain-containing protein [Bacteroidales bacterium]
MKRIHLYLIAITAALVSGCYDDYELDYDYDAIYTAYQYDLRTFVMGEKQGFDFTVALGGVVSNNRDRSIEVYLDNTLLASDLSKFSESGDAEPFTAIDAFKGKASFGFVSQPYVTEQVDAAGITSFEILPATYYNIEGLRNMTIAKGRHTATATISANDVIATDPKALAPYYALGFRIESADADIVLPEMSFEIIAIKCENKHFGYWYYEGERHIVDETSGNSISITTYTADTNQPDALSCYLTTRGFNSLVANKVGGEDGRIILTIAEDNTISVSSPDASTIVETIDGEPSYTNDATLLQNREIHLNYRFSNGDGTATVVKDVLRFKYRVRDGVLEYQDENPENY